jgi:glycerophosphoryl diester phosphodiesterase
VDVIEFDVRLTADEYFAVSHDARLRRVSKHRHAIHELSLGDLPDIRLHNGEQLPTINDALKAAGDTPVFIEAKGSGWAHPLSKFLRTYKGPLPPASVIAQDHTELATFQTLMPGIPLYVVQRFNPVDVFQTLRVARYYRFTGIDLNFWLLNPLTYWLAKRYKLEIVVYTVNSPMMARFLLKLFPKIHITTDHPERMQFLRENT